MLLFPTLKKEQEEWAKKHISRGVVSNSVLSTNNGTASASSAATKPTPNTGTRNGSTPSNNATVRSNVSSSNSKPSAYAKLAPFTEKHQSAPETGVAKKAGVYEKSKQSTALPTGLQKRFAWE